MHHDTQQKQHEGDIAGAAKRAQGRMEETGDEIRGHLEHIARDGRTRIATELRTVGEAATAAAEKLSEEDHQRIGSYVRGLRKQAERAADYVEQHDIRSVTSDLNRMARRNPALFIGGAALLGLVAGRFLSARPPRSEHDQYDADDRTDPWVRRQYGAAYDPDQQPAHSVGRPTAGATGYQSGYGSSTPGAGSASGSAASRGSTPGATPGPTTARPPIGRGSGEADGGSKFDQ